MSHAERPADVGEWTPARVIHLAAARDVDFVVELVNRLPDYEALQIAIEEMLDVEHPEVDAPTGCSCEPVRAALARLRGIEVKDT